MLSIKTSWNSWEQDNSKLPSIEGSPTKGSGTKSIRNQPWHFRPFELTRVVVDRLIGRVEFHYVRQLTPTKQVRRTVSAWLGLDLQRRESASTKATGNTGCVMLSTCLGIIYKQRRPGLFTRKIESNVLMRIIYRCAVGYDSFAQKFFLSPSHVQGITNLIRLKWNKPVSLKVHTGSAFDVRRNIYLTTRLSSDVTCLISWTIVMNALKFTMKCFLNYVEVRKKIYCK